MYGRILLQTACHTCAHVAVWPEVEGEAARSALCNGREGKGGGEVGGDGAYVHTGWNGFPLTAFGTSSGTGKYGITYLSSVTPAFNHAPPERGEHWPVLQGVQRAN